jgi:hypothetical protein
MYLWGATPFIAAALLTGATGAHTTAANHVAATPAVSLAGNGAASPVLHQVGTAWETTVLLNDINPGCGDVTAAKYWLAITAPYQVIGATPQSPAPIATTETTAGLGSSCQVTVTFPALSQRPQTATLVIDQAGGSSTVPLTVSRTVTLTDYLWIPASAGGAIAILSLLLSAAFVWDYDRRRKKRYTWRNRLQRPILGSGAWTANDSWATNISTGLVVVAAVLGVTSATNSLFPGVALDRFSIVNIAAGFFVVAAPVVFGILYARFTTKNPGLTADATIRLPRRRPATIRVPSGASITMAGDTTIQGAPTQDGSTHWAIVRGGGTYQIPPGSEIQLLTGIQDLARRCARAGTPPDANAADVQAGMPALRLAIEQALTQAVTQPGILAPELSAYTIRQAVMVEVAGDQRVWSAVEKVAREAAGAPWRPAPPGLIEHGREIITKAILVELEAALGEDDAAPTATDAMAYSGGADIGVWPASTLRISASAGTWTISASDVVTQPPVPPAPPASPGVPLEQPVLIDAAGGAKLTVTGAADISLPKDAEISAPGRPCYPLTRDRQLLAPQGTNIIVANLRMVLTVNILTMFGIGAELGVGFVLAGLSDASDTGMDCIFAALAVVAVLVLYYAATAARTLADPQPGSSISAQAGASFTL